MKKYLTIVAALLTLNILSANAQTESTTELQLEDSLTNLTCGETVTITATADEGYTFLYWEDDVTNTNPEREVTVSSELDLYNYVAVFTKNQTYALTITVNDSDMGSVVGGTGNYEVGTEVKLTAIPNGDCHKFLYWDDDHTLTNPERTITVTDNDETNKYKAIFAKVEFTVKVSAKVGEQLGGGKVTIARKTVE